MTETSELTNLELRIEREIHIAAPIAAAFDAQLECIRQTAAIDES